MRDKTIDNGTTEFRIKPVSELTFSDDPMFGAVMRNEDICKGVIERLLHIKVDRIGYPELQRAIEPFYSRKGIRMDVYVEGGNRVFDVECQTYREKSIGKRTRYYQSMLDADSLLKGHDYSELKESYVLFICLSDPFNKRLPVYTFDRVCMENKEAGLGDESHIVVFNTAAWKDEKDLELKAFLAFVQSSRADSSFTRRIERMVQEKKFENTFINEYMAWSLHDRDVKKRGIEEGIQQGAAQQKAEDEKLIARITAKKDAENEKLNERIAQLEAMLAKSAHN